MPVNSAPDHRVREAGAGGGLGKVAGAGRVISRGGLLGACLDECLTKRR
jgi:hypothetical protein